MFDPSLPFDPSGDVMRHYTTRARDAEYVSLKHYDIRSLEPLMSGLGAMSNMKTLCLSDNLLSSLPEDMSALTSLETLDVSRNPFPSASAVVRGLSSLPKLRHLLITISEDAEEQLVAALLNLQTINNVSLEFEARRGVATERDQQESMIHSLRVGAAVEPPRGYAALRHFDPKEALKYERWSRKDIEEMALVQQLVRKVSADLSNQKEYLDYAELVESHVLARTRSESDVIKSAIVKWNAKCLLLEYSFDEFVRSSAKYGSEVIDAVQAVFARHLALISEVSTIVSVMQDDHNAKLEALQEDLAKELLIKERIAATRGESRDDQVNSSRRDASFFSDAGVISAPIEPQTKVNRYMSLSDLRSLIKSLLNSKRDHDVANSTAHLPVETLEQHLFTFFYERSSSENDIRNGASSFMSAVRYYAKREVDVEVFLLILQCEIDEPYWDTFCDQRAFLFDVIQSITNGAHTEFFNESQVNEIVRVLSRNRDMVSSQEELLRSIYRGMTRNDGEADGLHVPIAILTNAILRHAVGCYRLSVRMVVSKFHALDPEKSGVITTGKFRQLLRVLFPHLTSQQALDIIADVDPHNNDVVNFSDVVHVFHEMNHGGGSSPGSVGPSTVSSPRAPRSVASAR